LVPFLRTGTTGGGGPTCDAAAREGCGCDSAMDGSVVTRGAAGAPPIALIELTDPADAADDAPVLKIGDATLGALMPAAGCARRASTRGIAADALAALDVLSIEVTRGGAPGMGRTAAPDAAAARGREAEAGPV